MFEPFVEQSTPPEIENLRLELDKQRKKRSKAISRLKAISAQSTPPVEDKVERLKEINSADRGSPAESSTPESRKNGVKRLKRLKVFTQDSLADICESLSDNTQKLKRLIDKNGNGQNSNGTTT